MGKCGRQQGFQHHGYDFYLPDGFYPGIGQLLCTAPIIGLLLVQTVTSGDWLAPTVGMFGFALALALPFTLFALFPSWLKSAPKSGSWMETIKIVLGFIELAFSLKFLSVADLAYGWHIMDREVFLSLWIVIFGLLGLISSAS